MFYLNSNEKMNKVISIAVFIGVFILVLYNSEWFVKNKKISIGSQEFIQQKPEISAENRGEKRQPFNRKPVTPHEVDRLETDLSHKISDSEVLERISSVSNEFREVYDLLMHYDICRTNSKMALRLTFETCADLNNASTVAQDVLSDIVWAEQSAQSRHLGAGYEMLSPTNNPSILRAVSRLEEARKHRLMAVQRLERLGIVLTDTERLTILTTDVNDAIGGLRNLIPTIDQIGN